MALLTELEPASGGLTINRVLLTGLIKRNRNPSATFCGVSFISF